MKTRREKNRKYMLRKRERAKVRKVEYAIRQEMIIAARLQRAQIVRESRDILGGAEQSSIVL